MVFICIALMASGVGYVFMSLFAICVSHLMKFLFTPFYLFNFCLLLLSFGVAVCVLHISSLSVMWFASIFCKSLVCFFIPLNMTFTEEVLHFDELQFSYF